MLYQNGNDIYFRLKTAEGAYVTSIAANVLTAGSWHTAMATWDGAEQRVYLDGILGDTDANIGTLDVAGSGNNWTIGTDHDDFNDADCIISHVALYKRAITVGEIAEIYTLDLAYWLERKMMGVYKAPVAVGTILPHIMQLSA